MFFGNLFIKIAIYSAKAHQHGWGCNSDLQMGRCKSLVPARRYRKSVIKGGKGDSYSSNPFGAAAVLHGVRGIISPCSGQCCWQPRSYSGYATGQSASLLQWWSGNMFVEKHINIQYFNMSVQWPNPHQDWRRSVLQHCCDSPRPVWDLCWGLCSSNWGLGLQPRCPIPILYSPTCVKQWCPHTIGKH